VKHFISLGLAANEEIATSFFRNLIESDNNNMTKDQVLQSEINVDTFLSLFDSNDGYSIRILKVLDKAVRESRSNQQKQELLHQNVPSDSEVVMNQKSLLLD
jgi:hypothetical protein